jgi:hypothetical protein
VSDARTDEREREKDLPRRQHCAQRRGLPQTWRRSRPLANAGAHLRPAAEHPAAAHSCPGFGSFHFLLRSCERTKRRRRNRHEPAWKSAASSMSAWALRSSGAEEFVFAMSESTRPSTRHGTPWRTKYYQCSDQHDVHFGEKPLAYLQDGLAFTAVNTRVHGFHGVTEHSQVRIR